MSDGKPAKKGVAARIGYFFKQTFRRHSGNEYSELLSRGLRHDDGVNRQFPWAYMRLFALFFILYAVFLLVLMFTGNELFSPVIMLLASVTFNVPFMILLFELYPKNSLSFVSLIAVLIIGSTCADVLVQVLFSICRSPNAWVSAVYAGCFEELCKGVIVVLALLAIKKKEPFLGFLIGAAIGCGFSITEDLGRVFLDSSSLPSINVPALINMTMSRGMSAFCTHILWSGAIGWAFAFFKKPLINPCFWGISLVSVGLHICWDLPLPSVWLLVVQGACVVAIAVECLIIVHRERNKILKSAGAGTIEEQMNFFNIEPETLDVRRPEHYTHAGNLCLTICAFLMAVAAVIFCTLPIRTTHYSKTLYSPEELTAFMQEDLSLTIDDTRQFVEGEVSFEANGIKNGDKVYDESNRLIKIEQMEKSGEVIYHYDYNVVYPPAGNAVYFLTDIRAEVIKKEGSFTYMKESLYSGGKLYATFFRVRQDVTGFNFSEDSDNSEVTVFLVDLSYEMDLSKPPYVFLFITFGAFAVAGLISFAVCHVVAFVIKKKISGDKKDE